MCRITSVKISSRTSAASICQEINSRHLGNIVFQILPAFAHNYTEIIFKFEDYPTYKHFSSRYPEWFPLLTPEEFFK